MVNATVDRNEEGEQKPMSTTSATKIAPGPRFGEVCEDLIMHYSQHADGGCECQEMEKYQFSNMLEEYHREGGAIVNIDDSRHAAIGFALRRSEHYLEPTPSGAPNWEPDQLVAHRLGYDEAGIASLRLHLETLKPIYDACTPEHSAKIAALEAKMTKLNAPFDPQKAEVGIRNIYRGKREDGGECLSVGILDEKDGSCGRLLIETDDQYLVLDSADVLDLVAALVVARKAIDENAVRVSSGH
jgi:hypothetical protein